MDNKMPRYSLGILQVNHDRSHEIGDRFPDDSHRFRDLLDRLEMRFDYRVYMTIGGELPDSPQAHDGFLITGSPLSVLDDSLSWRDDLFAFIRACDAAKTPLIGACFGHQAVAVALGGTVAKRAGGYNVGVEATQFHADKPFMKGAGSALSFHMFHEDEVVALPEDVEVIGASDGCAIASFTKGKHILAVQAHPEFHDSFMRAVLEFSKSAMSEDCHDAALASLAQPTDGAVFAEWMASFLTGKSDGGEGDDVG